ncbi:MAG: LacI family DNA-binding transcriptional regulator [Woeseia sp.]|jgi:LacI family transcriptional regulator|nr:LacI family DNA-binding transcriptional regulator [Woeseia sp.]
MVVRTKTPTINDVAALAGVHKRTVTRVLNGSEKVKVATRSKVEQAISELNFSPNRQARGLAAQRSFLLGLIYDLPTLFVNEVQQGMLHTVEEEGYELVVHVCSFESERAVENITRFVNRANLDGVIILPPVSEIEGLGDKLEEVGCRFVRVTSDVSDVASRLVVTDYLSSIADMVRHLVDLGHRDFGFISGPSASLSSRKRHDAFVQSLENHGLELADAMVAEGAYTYDSGFQAAKALLSHERRPTAIFAANDEMAFAVMNVAAHLGLKIPDDLSVVGFDGSPFSTFVVPSLSTNIRQSDEVARLATQKLLAQINEDVEAASDIETMVSPRFVPRESTGPASER